MCLAIPTKVLTVDGNVATVDVQGVQARVRLDALGEEVRIGDYLLVHAGFAIRRLDPQDAAETLALFDELFALDPQGAPPPGGVAPDPAGPRHGSRPV
ncbi:MAG: HypC/HybG/HupF family hydrogenase formation chaperone [Candidatus Bipolaricaulis sp.]|nr:HypC/HybG/HupF family hydrogenase formation chaperone [Candidatus Bipolaricaulis sp.]HQM38267.1 HypC/HybG/HupF family hydrogenase formation chaperone [Candidatus Bipolaricaulis anaerobius]